jgi:hypothetical protein
MFSYPKKIIYKPEGKITIERPLTRWKDDFREEKNRPKGLSLIVDDDHPVFKYTL